MDAIRSSSTYNVQSSSANPTEATQTARAHPSGHADSLIARMLSDYAVTALNDILRQGDKRQSKLAGFAIDAISSGQLKLSPNQPLNGIAQFGIKSNQDVLIIQAKLNEQSKYDVLSIGFKSGSEAVESVKLPTSLNKSQGKLTTLPPRQPLLNMPLELQHSIMEQVFAGSTKRQSTYDLTALENSTRLLKYALNGNSLLKFKHNIQKKIIGAINKLSVYDLIPFSDSALFPLASKAKKNLCVSETIKYLDENRIAALAGAFKKLKKEQCSALVYAILNARLDDDGDLDMELSSTTIGSMIGSLGKSMHMITMHHAEIINFIMNLPESGMSWAIHGLGEGLHTLDKNLCKLIIKAVLDIEDDYFRGIALGGLTKGLTALAAQRQMVLDIALAFPDDNQFSNFIVPGFCENFNNLTTDEQHLLANVISQMNDEDEQARSIGSLGNALKKINGQQYVNILEILISCILSMESDKIKAIALGFLGAGLHHENSFGSYSGRKHEHLITNIFNAVMEIPNEAHKSRAIEGIGGGLSAFSIDQRRSLVMACLSMRNEENISRAVSGLGAGLTDLDSQELKLLFDCSLNMRNEMHKSEAIAGLGRSITVFTAKQQTKFVDVAVNMEDEFKGIVIASLKNVGDIKQFDRLVDAALSLPPTNIHAGLLSPQALALASLVKSELL